MADLPTIDHEETIVEDSLFQFQDKEVIQGLLKSWVESIQDTENVTSEFHGINIYNAVGLQLDQLYGELFNLSRSGRNDTQYRAALLAKISTFGSDGTFENLQENLETVTASTDVTIFEHFPADIHAHIGGTYSGYTYQEADDLVLAGVSARLIADNDHDSWVMSEVFETGVDIQANVFGVPTDIQAEFVGITTDPHDIQVNLQNIEQEFIALAILPEIEDQTEGVSFVPIAELIHSSDQIPDSSVLIVSTFSSVTADVSLSASGGLIASGSIDNTLEDTVSAVLGRAHIPGSTATTLEDSSLVATGQAQDQAVIGTLDVNLQGATSINPQEYGDRLLVGAGGIIHEAAGPTYSTFTPVVESTPPFVAHTENATFSLSSNNNKILYLNTDTDVLASLDLNTKSFATATNNNPFFFDIDKVFADPSHTKGVIVNASGVTGFTDTVFLPDLNDLTQQVFFDAGIDSTGVAWNNDGTLFALDQRDGTLEKLKVFNAPALTEVVVNFPDISLNNPNGVSSSLAFDPNGRFLAIYIHAGNSISRGDVVVFDTTQEPFEAIQGPLDVRQGFGVVDMQFSPDGDFLAAVSSAGAFTPGTNISIYDVRGYPFRKLAVPNIDAPDGASKVVWNTGGDQLAILFGDDTIDIYDFNGSAETTTFSATITPGLDTNAGFGFDFISEEPQGFVLPHSGELFETLDVSLSASGDNGAETHLIVNSSMTGADQDALFLREAYSPFTRLNTPDPTPGSTRGVGAVAISPDGTLAAVATKLTPTSTVVYDITTSPWTEVANLVPTADGQDRISFNRQGTRLALSNSFGVRLYDTATWLVADTIGTFDLKVRSLVYSKHEDLLAIVSDSQTGGLPEGGGFDIHVYDVSGTPTEVANLQSQLDLGAQSGSGSGGDFEGVITGVDFQDGYLAVVTTVEHLAVFRTSDWVKQAVPVLVDDLANTDCLFNDAGTILAITRDEVGASLSLLDTTTIPYTILPNPADVNNGILSCAFDRTGTRFATFATSNQEVRIYEVVNGVFTQVSSSAVANGATGGAFASPTLPAEITSGSGSGSGGGGPFGDTDIGSAETTRNDALTTTSDIVARARPGLAGATSHTFDIIWQGGVIEPDADVGASAFVEIFVHDVSGHPVVTVDSITGNFTGSAVSGSTTTEIGGIARRATIETGAIASTFQFDGTVTVSVAGGGGDFFVSALLRGDETVGGGEDPSTLVRVRISSNLTVNP